LDPLLEYEDGEVYEEVEEEFDDGDVYEEEEEEIVDAADSYKRIMIKTTIPNGITQPRQQNKRNLHLPFEYPSEHLPNLQ
jgi:hypothetical protein